MERELVTKLIDALSARTQFGNVMNRAENENIRFLVSRRGKPKVVILSVEDYLRNIIRKPSVLTEIQADALSAGLDEMSDEEISAEISACRQAMKR
ncbi:MAG: type II toxin-antitoxin system prevent-host-death family antitoxin [Desulfococcaceae bacterium]